MNAFILLTLLAADPMLVPAPGSPIAASGGALIAADVNGDGCADLMLCLGSDFRVYLGDRERAWPLEPDRKIPIGGSASEAAVADFNGDGHADLALADHDSYEVRVLLGDGKAGFQPADGSPFAARLGDDPHTHGIAAADVDGNGTLDLVTANNSPNADVALLLGDGRGGFARASKSPFPCGKGPYPIAAVDLDGDGFADVIVPNSADDLKTLHVLKGSAEGLGAASPIECDATLWFAATGDLNRDGKADVVATHSEGGSGVTILLNDGRTLTPSPSSPLDLDHGAWGIAVADMDRDGNADLVIGADIGIQVFRGDGRGGFSPAPGSPFQTGKGAWRLVVADFNGDGKPDVATNCVEAQHIEIRFGNLLGPRR